MFEGFFGYLIGGALIGVIARLFKPGPEPVGMIATIAIGAVGAAIGGLAGGRGLLAWAVAIASAVALLFAWKRVFHPRRRPPVVDPPDPADPPER